MRHGGRIIRWTARRVVGLLVLLLAATVYGGPQVRVCSYWPVPGGMPACAHAHPLNSTWLPPSSRGLLPYAWDQGWACTPWRDGWVCTRRHA